jgi:hypothetical protein
VRARGCLVGLGVVLAIAAAVTAVVGPGLLQRARIAYAPISRIKGEQREFESWARERQWHEPATPELDAATLERFLALRRDLRRLDDKGASVRRRPGGERPRFGDVPAIVETGAGLAGERLAAFRARDVTPDQYDYLERLVYTDWLRPLLDAGNDPAMRDRAAAAVEQAAAREAPGAVERRLRQVAAGLREQALPAPPSVPEDVHRLLLAHAAEIEAQPVGRIPPRVPRARDTAPSSPAASR